MRSKYALRNSMLSILIFLITGIMQFITRKVMLPMLGLEIIGLMGTITDILSFLNLSDMGLSGSVGASLYEPISQDNYPKIKGILLFLKKAYLFCGTVFTSAAVIIAVIMLIVFKSDTISNVDATVCFLLMAANTGLSYLFSYRLIVLSTDQRLFSLKLVNAGIRIVSTVAKVIVLIETHSFALFLIVDIVFTLIYYFIMNALIKKYYAKVEEAQSVLEPEDKSAIFRNVKGLACHQIGGFALYGTNNLYTSIFSGFAVSGKLSIYQMIITMLSGLVINFAGGTTASIGNLIATADNKKQYHIFRMIFMFVCLFVIVSTITFINSVQAFMSAFFGKDTLVEISVVYLLAASFFLAGIRPVTEQFKSAAGIFYEDRFVPLAEAVINTFACIILGKLFGLVGVIAGNVFSTLAIVSWQKPYMTFKYVFHKKLRYYFIDLVQYVLVGAFCLFLSSKLCGFITSPNMWVRFFEQVGISLVISIVIPLAVFFKTARFQNLWEYIRSIKHTDSNQNNIGK